MRHRPHCFQVLAAALMALLSTGLPAAGFTVLGSGTAALLGGDLTDPENNGVDGSAASFNWVSIVASSENDWSSEGAFNVFDNQVGEGDAKWCCDPAPQWIAVKFDKPYVLTHFTLSAGNDAADRDPTRWRIEGSNDGTTWTTIYDWTAGVSVFSQRYEVIRFEGGGADFPSPAPYAWFRYQALSITGPMHQINEIELFGIPTVVIKGFVVDKPLIPPGEPVTLTWEVHPGTTAIAISGLGDVSGQTVNGHGSLTLNPGPPATTVYTLSATHPDTTAQQTVTVMVTDQPVIQAFSASPAIIGPGGSTTLEWDVFNATAVALNGSAVTGTLSQTVSPGSTTTYTLTATNPRGTVSLQTTVTVVEPGVPGISEFMADNDGAAVADGDGDFSDWIEIHNPSATIALLDGYFLTDEASDLQKWAFPAVTLAPGGYLVVFASGKNRVAAGAPLHTNFSLDADGEYLALVKPDGVTIVSEFGGGGTAFPSQEEGVSYGLFGNPPQPGYFSTATPATSNSGGFSGYVRDTKFSLNRGFQTTAQTLAITSGTPGASIRYTTDGSWPSETAGTLYAGPIVVDRTLPVRAIAYKPGHRSTNVDTHTYIFLNDVVTQTPATTQSTWGLPALWGSVAPDYGMDPNVVTPHNATIRDDLKTVPTLSVVMSTADMFGPSGIYTNPSMSGPAWERATSLEFIDPAHPDGSADFQLNCGLRIQGGAFRSFGLTPKKSFRALFKGLYGPTKLRYPLFGPGAAKEFDTLVLRAEANDGYQWNNLTNVQYARDEFGRRTAFDLGIPSARGRYLNLYINGVYWGIYDVVERPDSSFGEQYFGAKKDEWDGINFGTATNEGSTVPWNTMVSILSGITSATTEPARTAAFMRVQGLNSDGTHNPGWSDYLNVENYIDYLLVNWFIGNADWPQRNYYTGRERDIIDAAPLKGSRTSTGMHFFMWDAETSMLLNSSNDRTADTSGVCVPYGHLRSSREFRVRVGDRAYRALFNGGAFTPQPCLDRYADITRNHRSILVPELARWGDQHGTLRTIQNWQTAYDAVRNNWLSVRAPAFVSILKGAGLLPQTDAPLFSQRGGSVLPTTPVTMSTGADTIYYTLDGSDPRLIEGAANPAARAVSFGGGGGGGPVAMTYMDTGQVWRYLDDGSDQGAAWRTVSFDDAGWASGPSSLGYGGEGEGAGTTVSYGPDAGNRHRTTYFRTTVEIPSPNTFLQFLLRLKYDDGTAVYINGAEVIRANLPANAAAGDFASSAIADETTWKDFAMPTSRFTAGRNTIAVEIHQASGSSSDIRLDMFLRGEVTTGGAGNVSDPLFFSQPTLVKARAFSSGTGEWSPLNEAFFSIDSAPADASTLVVSEFSYRPASPTTAEEKAISTDRDDFEFIELMNIGTRTTDLTGVRLTSGVVFAFADGTLLAPGGRIVVAKSRAAFNQRYSASLGTIAVAGEFASGNLSNDGERIVLTSRAGQVIGDFTYDDQAPWPAAADGEGFSLVLIAPRTNPNANVAWNWRSSIALNGNPGASDTLGYAAWKLSHGITLDQNDADQDGFIDLAEYALGTPPEASSAASPISPKAITVGGDEYAALEIRRSQAAADDVNLLVETSRDLVTWAADAVYVGEKPEPDGATATLTFRSAQPLTVSPQVFLRATFILR